MGSKSKRRAERHPVVPGEGLRREAERLIEWGRLKEAVKQANLCYKAEPTPEHHRLLEQAYLLRANELRRNAMPTAAREVAQHLVDFGVTDPGLAEEAAQLLMALGMTRGSQALQKTLDAPEVRERLARQMIDQAVLHPDRAREAAPEDQERALTVRKALEALRAGREAEALEGLRDVARGSPFADWRLFVRGLAAFYRGAADEAKANWDRLDPNRSPARIAQGLLSLTGSPSEATVPVDRLAGLEKEVFGASVLEPLEAVRRHAGDGDWSEASRRLPELRSRLERLDPKLPERLTRILVPSLLQAATERPYYQAETWVKGFTRAAQPLAIDPKWNRFWALLWEGPQGALDEAEEYWRAYLKDLEAVTGLKPEERTLARALVLEHLGKQCIEEAEELAGPSLPGPFGTRPSARDLKRERKRAVALLEDSLRLAPDRREAYHTLLEAYEEWGQLDEAAAVARRLLERFPDDFDAWMFLADYHFRRQEPEPAIESVRRARELRPLDERAMHEESYVQVLRARTLALKGRFDEGRAALAEAERLWPQWSEMLHTRARQVAFELKAGESDRAEALIAAAREALVEPTPLWLAVLIEGIRYQLPAEDRNRFEGLWIKALPKRVRSETAGALSEVMGSYLSAEIDYPGRAEHVRQVVDYLRRTSRTKYRLPDLKDVCGFLSLVPQEEKLHEKMVQRGLKLFPQSATFLAMAGALEMKKGPFGGGDLYRAKNDFTKALEQAEASGDAHEREIIPQIRQSLSRLTDLLSGPLGMPFAGFGGGFPMPRGGGPAAFRELLDTMTEMMGLDPEALEDELGMGDFEDDDFDDDDEDEDGGWDEVPPLPPPLPRPRRPSPASKKKKKRKKG